MADQKPDPNKPKPDIPLGKPVGDRPAPRPKAVPAAAPLGPTIAMPPVTDYDVELVAVPNQPPRKPREVRSLIDLDRRDFIMLGAGAGGTILAVLAGLLAAKVLERKPEAETPKSPD